MAHHHHHVSVQTISAELGTIKTAIGFLTQADLYVELNAIAASHGLPTPFLITTAGTLIGQANSLMGTLPNGAALASATNFALSEDINTGRVGPGTASVVVGALNDVLPLPAGSLFAFATNLTFLNARATHAAVRQDPQINRQLSVNWNQPLNLAAAELRNLNGDLLHYRALGFSLEAGFAATINDIQTNNVI
jgi:hypothetical protein